MNCQKLKVMRSPYIIIGVVLIPSNMNNCCTTLRIPIWYCHQFTHYNDKIKIRPQSLSNLYYLSNPKKIYITLQRYILKYILCTHYWWRKNPFRTGHCWDIKLCKYMSCATMRVDMYLSKVPFALFSSLLLHVEL